MLNKFSTGTSATLVLLASPLFAQNGAQIIRGQDDLGMFDWDGNETFIVVATDMYFWCGDEVDNYPYDWMAVARPDGTIKGHERGNGFARVYQPATPDGFFCRRSFYLY